MLETDLPLLIQEGEGLRTEFKQSTNDITKDVYDTVCSFSNREGGTILLGVTDKGEILGITPEKIGQIKKNFITAVNNGQKISPPLYLQPEILSLDEKLILAIQVPPSSQVIRHNGRIYDRNHEADIDITDNPDLVYQLYARKNNNCYVNKITRFTQEDLRPDLIERARAMAARRNDNHPWKAMTDEELLRSSGLLLKNPDTQIEGVTLAAILLFGKDSTIMSVLPQHKTDAIFRVEDLDRYDDREVIITNLLDSYDQLVLFARKHLSDPFVLD